MMRRREFIAGLGSAAAWPVVARAQQRPLPVVGYLDSRTATVARGQVEAFRQGLREAGFTEDRNVAIEFKWAEDRRERLPELAADLVRRQVAVIVAVSGPTATAAKAATSTIPIVFTIGADPVEAGLVSKLNRPGGNVTGVSFTASTLNAKRLELLHDLVAKPALIAVLLDPNSRDWDVQLRNLEAAARSLGRQVLIVKAGTESEIDGAFPMIVKTGAGALFVGTGPLYNSRRRQLVTLAGTHRLAASYHLREFVEAGGLMSYGASTEDAYRHTGLYVSRILKGEKPGDMPVELPTRYELVLNLATARTLKLDIPPKLLAIADEVIE
jgi:putative tryptophan/tyrosine transport system substrate-binding protein